MLNRIKKTIYFKKLRLLFTKGLIEGSITEFDNDLYEKLSHTYITGIPVSIHIKFFKPVIPPGKCYDRSLYMFFSLDNAILVRGDNKDLELNYGKSHAGHGWIELDNYVYDPSLMLRFEKDIYYKMYMPTNVNKCTLQEYLSDEERNKIYYDIKKTSIDDYKPYGKKRIKLANIIPLVTSIAKNSNNLDFIRELNKYLELIEYDEEEVYNELQESFNSLFTEEMKYKRC